MILEEEKKSKIEIAGEMASQYKRLQENLQRRITQLTDESNTLQSNVETQDDALMKLKRERDMILEEKENTINGLKKAMTQMSDQFLEMLKETLAKIRARIDSASVEFDKTNEGSLRKKLEEFTVAKD